VPYRVDFRQASQAALLRLLDLGPLDAEFLDDGHGAALMPDSVTPDRVARALELESVAVSPALGRDAESVWVLGLRPVRIGRLRLVHDRRAGLEPLEPGDVRLMDTPAFGTGLHATTALCLEILDEVVHGSPPDAMLDVGTGSGVLALAALRLGVPRAVAIDIDEHAVRATIENGRRNALSRRLRVIRAGPDGLLGRWPLVVANVLAAPLMEMAPALAMRVGPSGRLVLSGVSSALLADVERAYRRVGMHVLDVRRRAGWVAVVLQAPW
jgi:ribosomal protein L11 methyltransferase